MHEVPPGAATLHQRSCHTLGDGSIGRISCPSVWASHFCAFTSVPCSCTHLAAGLCGFPWRPGGSGCGPRAHHSPALRWGLFLATRSLSEAFTCSCSVRSWWPRRCRWGLGAGNLMLKCITNKKKIDRNVSESPCLVGARQKLCAVHGCRAAAFAELPCPWFDQISSCERMAPRSLLIRIYQIKSFIACSQLYFCLHCLAVFVGFFNWALDLCCTCTRSRPFAAPTRSAVVV